jgi:hypothetical protein
MTAIACLRIIVGEELMFADQETMADLVAKVASSYLETRWLWPRRYGLVAPFAFVLADPRVTLLDPRELQALAAELHVKLFGQESEGDVTLLTFEGDQNEVMKFVGASRQELTALMRGNLGALASRVCRITRDEVVSVLPEGGSITGLPDLTVLEREGPQPARAMFRGVYNLHRQRFMGNALIWRAEEGRRRAHPSAHEGAHPDDDIPGIDAAPEALEQMPVGLLFLPISFSTLVKPSRRAALLSALGNLPPGLRPRLAATVYDTPRSPTFGALTQMRTALDPFFSGIDLRVVDPAFQVDYLARDMAQSVTLVLPPGAEKERLAALARFMENHDVYRRKGVLQNVAEVKSRRELDTCVRLGVPFVSGPAVCDLMDAPVGQAAALLPDLPVRGWSVAA